MKGCKEEKPIIILDNDVSTDEEHFSEVTSFNGVIENVIDDESKSYDSVKMFSSIVTDVFLHFLQWM